MFAMSDLAGLVETDDGANAKKVNTYVQVFRV
jgi:hypothetical protein